MDVVTANLMVEQIRNPADHELQPAVIAEIARADSSIKSAAQGRDQSLYYLLGLVAGATVFGLNAVLNNSLGPSLRTHEGLKFAGLVLLVQGFLWVLSLLAVVVYGVVFKSNDGIRFSGREIARLNDVLYGLPEQYGQASPGWVAVQPTAHDVRDRDDVFPVNDLAEWVSLAILAVSLAALAAVTGAALAVTTGWLFWIVLVLGVMYACLSGALTWWRVLPLAKSARVLKRYDRESKQAQLRSLSRIRRDAS